MRLLNTHNHTLKTFFGDNIPCYAILSHTWRSENDEEILFEDVRQPLETWKKKLAFTKVYGFCETAAADALDWVWIDTCCIDKSSSAELSEAINSMYRWYEKADVCYVYLEDVESKSTGWGDLETFKSSRWFSRGWTLQELLAPQTVEFYDRNWNELGTKRSLQATITERTGIRGEILVHSEDISECTIAERMSWAADRQTTREEDSAYCLFGIFDIHMPLQYGEAEKAFQRFQEEILKVTEDYTWLAWTTSQSPNNYSVFAKSPSDFVTPFVNPPDEDDYWRGSGTSTASPGNSLKSQLPLVKQQPKSAVSWNYSQLKLVDSTKHHLVSSCVRSLVDDGGLALDEFPRMTPRGLRLTLPIIKDTRFGLVAFLRCICKPDGRLVCLALEKVSYGSDAKCYKRADKGVVLVSDEEVSLQYKTIYLKTTTTFMDTLREAVKMGGQRETEIKYTMILSTGINNSPVLVIHQVGCQLDMIHLFVLRYMSVNFYLLFGFQQDGWCYFAIDQDHALLSVQTDRCKQIIAERIEGQESDRAEVAIKGRMIYCKIKKRNRYWIDRQASFQGPELLDEVKNSDFLYSIDIWALPYSLEQVEVVKQEEIEGMGYR